MHSEILHKIRINDPELIKVDFSQHPLSSSDIQELAKALMSNNYVEELDLSDCGLDNECAQILATINNGVLRTLFLDDNPNINAAGITDFESNSTYTHLSLANNPNIGPRGATTLSKNTTLKMLDLGWCNIGDEGCQALLANTHFEELWLLANNITITGFINVHGPHPSLRKIHIAFNPLGNKCVRWIAETLAKSQILIALDLRGTSITDRGALGFQNNLTLWGIDLSSNRIQPSTIQVLQQDFNRHQLFNSVTPQIRNRSVIDLSVTRTDSDAREESVTREVRFLSSSPR